MKHISRKMALTQLESGPWLGTLPREQTFLSFVPTWVSRKNPGPPGGEVAVTE